jgi:hypothetical protein
MQDLAAVPAGMSGCTDIAAVLRGPVDVTATPAVVLSPGTTQARAAEAAVAA